MAVLDLSEGGARLLLTVRLHVGEEVTMVLGGPACEMPLRCLGKVVWSIEVTKDRFAVGVRLDSPLNGNDVQRLTIP